MLQQAIQSGLDRAVAEAYRASPNPDEVDFLRAIFKHGLSRLEADTSSVLSAVGLQTRISGLYVHGRPKLTYRAPPWYKPRKGKRAHPTCELGDLLVLVRYAAGRPPVNYALLLQGKRDVMRLPIQFKPSQAEFKQFHLLRRWPEFWWSEKPFAKTSGSFDAEDRRHIQPAKVSPGAQYLAIQRHVSAKAATLTTLLPDRRDHGRPFAAELADLVHRGTGRKFSSRDVAQGRIGWDRVIWDLLDSWFVSKSQRRLKWRYHNVDVFFHLPSHGARGGPTGGGSGTTGGPAGGTPRDGGPAPPHLPGVLWNARLEEPFEELIADAYSMEELSVDREIEDSRRGVDPPAPDDEADGDLPGPGPIPTVFIDVEPHQ